MARLIGYQNVSMGARRIEKVERGEIADAEFLEKLIAALRLDREQVAEAIEMQEREAEAAYQAWLDGCAPVTLHIRLVGAVCLIKHPPEHLLSEEAIIEWARAEARRLHCKACLAMTRRESVWFIRNGEVNGRTFAQWGIPNVAVAMIKGTSQSFAFKEKDGRVTIAPTGLSESGTFLFFFFDAFTIRR